MEPSEVQRAVDAARATASGLGLRADDALVVHNSNRIAVHLTPCDVLARVAPLVSDSADELELEVARRLVEVGAPVAGPLPGLEPRVHTRDGFAITLWTYYEPVASALVEPAEYAHVLLALHAGLRQVEVPAAHFTERVAEAERLLDDPAQTPELVDADRELLSNTLRRVSASIIRESADEQLLHGEPHVGNVLRTRSGLLFIDFETCCRGPVEFDMAHALLPDEDGRMLATEDVREHYPGTNRDVVVQSRILIWAMITTWRWRHDDQLPNGAFWRVEGLEQLRRALSR